MAESVTHLISVIHNEVFRNINTFAMKYKLTGTQIQILDYLNKNTSRKNIFQRDVEKHFNIRRSTATNILKIMENKNLIDRIPFENDSRLKLIIVKPSGKMLQNDIDKYLKATNKKILASLNAFDERNIMKSLKIISEKLQKEE